MNDTKPIKHTYIQGYQFVRNIPGFSLDPKWAYYFPFIEYQLPAENNTVKTFSVGVN